MKVHVSFAVVVFAVACTRNVRHDSAEYPTDLNMATQRIQELACVSERLHHTGRAYERAELLRLLGLPKNVRGRYSELNFLKGETFRLSPKYYLSFTLAGDCRDKLVLEEMTDKRGRSQERREEILYAEQCTFDGPVVVESTFAIVKSPTESCETCLGCAEKRTTSD